MKIQIGLMAHRSREDYAKTVQPVCEFTSWDESGLGLVQAHVQAWEMFDCDPGGYCVLLQDDIILTSDFTGKLSYHLLNCVERYGRIGFHAYLRNTRKRSVLSEVSRSRRKGIDHVLFDRLFSGNSIALPSEHVKPMLEHFKTMYVPSGDQRIEAYLQKHKIPIYFPLPSLVEHRSLDSLHDGNVSRHEYRKALYFEP